MFRVASCCIEEDLIAMVALLKFVGFLTCVFLAGISGGLTAISVSPLGGSNCGESWICSRLKTSVAATEAAGNTQPVNCLTKPGVLAIAQFTSIIAYPSTVSEDALWNDLAGQSKLKCMPIDVLVAAACRQISGGGSSLQECAALSSR